jgi:antitoxin (DNA-binding transcriptional repressor) of toxin-antitoxin stability system
MDLRRVESVGIGKARKDLYDILRRVEGGSHYLLLRFDRPVAAVISHPDYLAFSELARQDALMRAVLQGKGYRPASLSVEEFLDILADHVKGGADAGR